MAKININVNCKIQFQYQFKNLYKTQISKTNILKCRIGNLKNETISIIF